MVFHPGRLRQAILSSLAGRAASPGSARNSLSPGFRPGGGFPGVPTRPLDSFVRGMQFSWFFSRADSGGLRRAIPSSWAGRAASPRPARNSLSPGFRPRAPPRPLDSLVRGMHFSWFFTRADSGEQFSRVGPAGLPPEDLLEIP